MCGQIPTGSQANGKLSGKVLGADGKPVAGTRLSLRASGSNTIQANSATTDESGTFAFSNLAPGDYFLSAAKGAYMYQGFTSKDQPNPANMAPTRIERGSEEGSLKSVGQRIFVMGSIVFPPLPQNSVTSNRVRQ